MVGGKQNKFANFKKEKITSKNLKYRQWLLLFIFLGASFGVAMFLYIIYVPDQDDYFCEKAPLQNNIKQIIIHGGRLDDVKHVYRLRHLKKKTFTDYLKSKSEEYYYEANYPLSGVITDLLYDFEKERGLGLDVNNLSNNSHLSTKDSLYLSSLAKLIREIKEDPYRDDPPFDNLDNELIYHFDHIKEILGSDYSKISSEENAIIEHLVVKDKILTAYKHTSLFFNLSVLGIIISLIIAFIQIYISYKSTNDMIKIIENKLNNETDNKLNNETENKLNNETENIINNETKKKRKKKRNK